MRDNFVDKAAASLLRHHKRRRWRQIVSVLAAIVVFVTTYALILPAISLENNSNSSNGLFYITDTGEYYIPTTAIEEGKPYAILGGSRSNAVKAEETSGIAPAGLSVDPVTGVETVVNNCCWYFEAASAGYYIYMQDQSGARQYLYLTGQYATASTNRLAMTSDKTQATAFSIGNPGNNQVRISKAWFLSMCVEGVRYSNTTTGKNVSGNYSTNDEDSESTQSFTGYVTGMFDNSKLYLYTKLEIPATVETVSPASSVINLFDYWIGEERTTVPEKPSGAENLGINTDRPFKFGPAGSGGSNTWTGSGGGAYQGIVQNRLSYGYPALNTDLSGVNADNASLAYLFDPTAEVANRAAFSDVRGLLKVDEDGYFTYNCHNNYAYFDEAANSFQVYGSPWISNGGYFPFNSLQELKANNINDYSDSALNHYFGMTITSNFYQQNGGYTYESGKNQKATTFEFTGDDDVWIFIDDVLVADIGGIHDPAATTINFVTGDVTVTPVSHTESGSPGASTTIRAAFEAAGADTSGFAGNTFADNTTHTLKFFYLERGGYASNLQIKYNLIDVPSTAIYKVDQYGSQLSGSRFGVYQALKGADGSYRYKTDSGDTVGITLSADAKFDEKTGVISDGANRIDPAFVGETDARGEMVFKDSSGSLYTMAALRVMFGDYFIMREIYVPEGYRTVSDEIWMYLEGGLMFCDNTYRSGVWASNNALVTATRTLYAAGEFQEGGARKTYPPDGSYDGSGDGTLFAVALKRNGAGTDVDTWYPVYGSDAEGYKVLSTSGMESVITAAREAQKYAGSSGSITFGKTSTGMQAYLEHLPGDPHRYYTWLQQNDRDVADAEYFVAYYYTDGSLEEANVSNTRRVVSRSGIIDGYSGFTIAWGTTIEVPDFENRLFFQKLDEDRKLVDGAVFALYPAMDAPNTAETTRYVYYIGSDSVTGDGNTAYIALLTGEEYDTYNAAAFLRTDSGAEMVGFGSYEIDGDGTKTGTQGRITVTITEDKNHQALAASQTYYVFPAQNAAGEALVGDTHDVCPYVSEQGTGHFLKLKHGQYYLREISAPAGYTLNETNVPVLVNKNGVYANAGVSDDGVSVGNGIGFLTKTLDVFASKGDIDETLTWVYAALLRNNTAGFTAFDDISGDVIYVTEKGSWEFVTQSPAASVLDGFGDGVSKKRGEAMITYLEYNGILSQDKEKDTIFDYTQGDQNYVRTVMVDGESATLAAGENTIRLYLHTGWSDMAVYQDYAYGINQTSTNNTTYYTDLTSYGNISNLFSNSTFVQVTGETVIDAAVKNVSAADPNQTLSGASFRLSYTADDGTVYYYRISEDGKGSWTKESAGVTTDENGLIMFENLTDGVYTLEELEAPEGYRRINGPVTLEVNRGTLLIQDSSLAEGVTSDGGKVQSGNNILYTITVPNSDGYELPRTGGRGTGPVTFAGLLLVALAFCGYLLAQNKRV